MKDWIKSSFRNRIFVTVLLVTLLPMLLCDIFIMQIAMSQSRRQLREQALEELGGIERQFDGLYDEVDSVTAGLADSIVVRSALRRGGSDSKLLYQVLYLATSGLRGSVDFDVYDSDGSRRYTSAVSLTDEKLPLHWGALRLAEESDGLSCQADEGGGLVMARAVRTHSGTVLGYILAHVSQESFNAILGNEFVRENDVLLLDGTWRQVYSSDSIGSSEKIDALRGQLLKTGSPNGAGEYNFYLRTLPDTGFTLVLQQPKVYTSQVTDTIYRTCFMMGLLCLVLSLLCAWLISRYLSKPVNELDSAMGRVEKGEYDTELVSDRSDEMGRLTASFNRMTREYRQNLEHSVQREREINELQLSMMQAQPNPHFLYNTLDSVKWLGVTNHVPQVASMATNLAALLRAGISGDSFITLEEELELLEKYLDIQSLRFEDRFAWETDVDERFQHCIVPKLITQPLVENAIIHGVADMDDGYVKLTAREENGTLVLSVQDNGEGIPQEILDRLNSPDREMPAGHLGLRNVDRIVRLYYGEEYGISASATPGEGSCVELRLPMKMKEKMDNAEGSDR